MANQVVVIMWRDIPAQVNAQAGRQRVQVPLSDKFERAIDMAKRKGKIFTAHEDVAQWHRLTLPCGADLAAGASAEAARLEVEFPKERLGKIAFRGGWEHPEDHPADADPETLEAS
jgi:Virulence factor